MHEQKKLACFRQMEFRWDTCWLGLFFTAGGAAGVYKGLQVLLTGEKIGVVLILFAGLFPVFGAAVLLCHFRKVDITDKEVILRLGSMVLRRIPVKQIRTLGVTTMRINTKNRAPEAEIIVLSPHAVSYMLKIAGSHDRDIATYKRNATEAEKARAATRRAIRAYLSSCLSGLSGTHLPKAEGIWLEYSRERVEKLKELLPHAEHYFD